MRDAFGVERIEKGLPKIPFKVVREHKPLHLNEFLHGTTKQAAKKIKREGFRIPDGSSASSVSGKPAIWATKQRELARAHAAAKTNPAADKPKGGKVLRVRYTGTRKTFPGQPIEGSALHPQGGIVTSNPKDLQVVRDRSRIRVRRNISKGLPSYLRNTPTALLSPGLQRRVRLHEMGQTAARGAARAKQNPPKPKGPAAQQMALFERSGPYSQRLRPTTQAKGLPRRKG